VPKKTVSKSEDDFQLQQLKNGKLSRLFIERFPVAAIEKWEMVSTIYSEKIVSIVNMRPWRQDFKQLQVLTMCLITVAISLLHG